MTDFPGKGIVAVVKTTPETVLQDYDKLLQSGQLSAGAAQRQRHAAEDQYLVANVVSGLLDRAVAAGRRDQDDAGRRLQLDRRAQRHRGRRHRRRRSEQQAEVRHRQVQRAVRVPVQAGSEVGGIQAQAAVPGAGQGLSRRRLHSRAVHRQEHRAPAHGEDARLHDHHRRDEECLRRTAPSQAPLDARRDPRNAGGLCCKFSRTFTAASSP